MEKLTFPIFFFFFFLQTNRSKHHVAISSLPAIFWWPALLAVHQAFRHCHFTMSIRNRPVKPIRSRDQFSSKLGYTCCNNGDENLPFERPVGLKFWKYSREQLQLVQIVRRVYRSPSREFRIQNSFVSRLQKLWILVERKEFFFKDPVLLLFFFF